MRKTLTINAAGKTPEQLKEEIINKVDSMVDEAMSKKKKGNEKPAYLHINVDENKEKSGFGVEVDYDGENSEVLIMLTIAVSQALHSIARDKDGEYNTSLIFDFVRALVAEYTESKVSEGEDE